MLTDVKLVLRTGLVNMGNTCYMNSTIQALLHTFNLREFFIKFDPRQRPCKKSGISRLFSHLMRNLCRGETAAISPSELKKGFGRLYPMFATSEQQDSHEFLMLLLDSLHEDLNRAKSNKMPFVQASSTADSSSVDSKTLAQESWKRNRAVDDSEILDWFNGQLRSTVRCETCKHCSHTFDEFMYLSVSVQATKSLELHGVDAEASGPLQDLRVRIHILPFQLPYSKETTELELIDLPGLSGVDGPGLRSMQDCRQEDGADRLSCM
ncbi:unnamed protein product [Schistocephalus solidus]|uniref:ubiquitinyl hydrolase 1 n=1 Tax=Schistocephalus solidus TaxID=70667 RepID=A0A183TD28_SCHSO|nr:unnamed protein product [Schistocephalus solidus]